MTATPHTICTACGRDLPDGGTQVTATRYPPDGTPPASGVYCHGCTVRFLGALRSAAPARPAGSRP
jgi:hypothetical protein